MANEKIVEIQGKKVKLVKPNVKISGECDFEYSKAYTHALKNGLLPRLALEKVMIDSGAWSKEDDIREAELSKDAQETILEMKFSESAEDKLTLRSKFDSIQEELTNISAKRQSLYFNSAEQRGDEARLGHLAWNCILNEDDSNIWSSKEELEKAPDNDFVKESVRELVTFNTDLESKVEKLTNALDELTGDNKKVETETTEDKKEEPPSEEEKPEEKPEKEDTEKSA